MKQRIITAIILVAIALPIVLLSEYLIYPIALGFCSLMAMFELLRVLGLHKRWAISLPAYVISVTLPVLAHDMFLGEDAIRAKNYILFCVCVIFAYLLYIMGAAVFSKGELSVSAVATTFLTLTYTVISFTAMSLIRYIDGGEVTFVLVFVSAWISDVGAYFVGSLIGKHKLIPEVSPKKTVEGAIGGIVVVILVFLLYGFGVELVTDYNANYIILAISGGLLALISQIGDLIASLIKREHNIKDYGNLLPGHGGIMDRFDSIIAVSTPLLAIVLIAPPFV